MLFQKEIAFRKTNFLLGVIGIITAVSMVVLFFIMSKASQNETRRLTRDMGFNLRIIPEATDMNDFWITGFSDRTMPERYVRVFVEKKSFSYAHLTATLHKRIEWNGQETILTGIAPDELEPKNIVKTKMIFAIPSGKVYLGYELARLRHLKIGDRVTVLGKEFEVERTLSETGSEDDIRLYFSLADLQKLVRQEGQISEIMALNCLCSSKGEDPLGDLRDQLSEILPDTRVIMNRTIAVARQRQRRMMENFSMVLLPVFLIFCAIWVGTISMINVMQRKSEIGLLRALGFGSWKIGRLFFSRAVAMGIIGALIGFGIGTFLALEYGPMVFKVTAQSVKPIYHLLIWALGLAPLFAVISSFIPVMYALSREPASILKEE